MQLKLYNTLSRKDEIFTPLDEQSKRVTFYSCGPTVYDYAHIGNFRSFLNADLLRRTLELLGYEVRHVMNMTDVGHMTDDEVADGGGEDKMEAAATRLLEAKKSGKLPDDAGDIDPSDPYAIAEFYIHAFLEDAKKLGLKVAFEAANKPELMPRPTDYIKQMIELISSLIDKDHAYVAADGVVYFDVQSFPEYGKLSGNTLEHLRAGEGGRVEEHHQAVKKHPADFLLWKPDKTHLMRWQSPWGEGFPGWHLECSVMAASLLGEEIDIHSGGEDNIFPHHECEIAQTCGDSGKEHFARFWFHTRHLIVEGEKMSKSKGNFYTVRDLLAKGASPAAIRLAIICTHYRTNANFTFQGLIDAQRQIDRWMRLHDWMKKYVGDADGNSDSPMRNALNLFTEHLADDLNIAGALGVLNEAAGQYDVSTTPDSIVSKLELDSLEKMLTTVGVFDLEYQAEATDDDLAAKVEDKIAERKEARETKNWARADEIRDELLKMGIAIKDNPQGTTWQRIVQ